MASVADGNGVRFEKAFNRIDNRLRSALGFGGQESFGNVLRTASKHDPLASRYYADLREFAELRNAIVHSRGVESRILADPTDEATAEIERIAEIFERPRMVRSLGVQKDIRIFGIGDLLPRALKYMRQNDFSQIIVNAGARHRVMTQEGLALWLESKVNGNIVSLGESTLADVLEVEPDYTSAFLPLDTVLEAVRQRFMEAPQRLYCLVFSEHGKPYEKPLRIVTPWDLNQFP